MKHFFVLIAFILFSNISYSKDYKLRYIGIALNNYVTAKPISGFPKLFNSQFHPGITLSTGFNWKKKESNSWMQSFKLGYLHHRFIQKSVLLYTEFGYRKEIKEKLGLSIALGGGYLHMIPGEEQFRLKDGEWQTIKLKSRPQAMLSLSLGVDYKIHKNGIRAFIRYQNMLQTPFVPGYVPLLPYNVLHLGTTIPMNLIKKGDLNQ